MTGRPHIARSVGDQEWKEDALCFRSDLDFFDESEEVTAQTKAVCRDCPVIEPCRAHSLAFPEMFGVWGGLTSNERKKLRRKLGMIRRRRSA